MTSLLRIETRLGSQREGFDAPAAGVRRDRHTGTAEGMCSPWSRASWCPIPRRRCSLSSYGRANSVSIRQYQSTLNRRFFFEEARILGFERFGDGWADLIYLSTDRAGLAAAKSFFGGNS